MRTPTACSFGKAQTHRTASAARSRSGSKERAKTARNRNYSVAMGEQSNIALETFKGGPAKDENPDTLMPFYATSSKVTPSPADYESLQAR